MVERDISKISIPDYIWKYRKKITKDYDILGFDTETENGYAILIMDSENRELIPNHIDEILKFLMLKRYQYTINFFYNVKYDTNAIIKYLPKNHIENLANFDETIYTDRYNNVYYINIIPDKLLKIRKGHHTVKFFDLAQFYDKQPLKNLAKKVDMVKYQLDDINNLKKDLMLSDENYKYEVVKRCYIDCIITKKLGNLLNNALKDFVKLRNFYSGASISRQLVLQNLNDKFLKIPSLKFMDMALKAYNAGRFEILKRGYFKTMVERDINSAYPYQIANLYETDGTYIYNSEYEPDSIHSFYNCDLEIYDCNYSPFKFELPKKKSEIPDLYNNLPTNLLIYPTGKFKNQYLSKSDYETIYNLGYPIKINFAGHIINSDAVKPFEYLDKIYYHRKKVEKKDECKSCGYLTNDSIMICPECKSDDIEKKDLELANTIKRGLNSIYGTFINVNDEKGLTQNESEGTKDFTIIDNEIWFSKNNLSAGNMFNPVFATEICSNVRNKLYNDFYRYEDKIICIATDGIKLTSDVNIKESNKLGGYDKSNITDGLLIGSGVYQFGDKAKFRGFDTRLNLIDLLTTYKDTSIVKSVINRVINLKYAHKNNFIKLVDEDGEIYKKHLTLEDINLFVKINRDLNINFDKKRIWDRDFLNCDDALNNSINSKPIDIENLK